MLAQTRTNISRQDLGRRGFSKTKADCCVYIRKNIIILVYVDDCILISKGKHHINDFIVSLKNDAKKYEFTDEGDMQHYLDIEITKASDGSSFILSQPFFIERILKLFNINQWIMNSKEHPFQGPWLSTDIKGKERVKTWKYRTAVGTLGYPQNSSRPNISMAVHHSFSKLSHE